VAFALTAHYDNQARFPNPHLRAWYAGSTVGEAVAPTGADGFGPVYRLSAQRPEFGFTFEEGPDGQAGDGQERVYRPVARLNGGLDPSEVWCRADRAFVYRVRPADAEPEPADAYLRRLAATPGFPPGLELPATGGLSGLGANLLNDGRALFGLYHPTAARIYLVGAFNDWQCPGTSQPDPSAFIELRLYRGWFGAANTWLIVTEPGLVAVGDEYKFYVQGGIGLDDWRQPGRFVTDPYARQLGPDYQHNNGVVVDPTQFSWTDHGWRTPDPADLVLYELSVHGFTDGDPDIRPDRQGRFDGITERIHAGYFDQLGVNALSLMPLAEVPSPQGPESLGYDPSLFLTIERDFGAPDDLRALAAAAHSGNLALLVDMVFNHTSNNFNPLWRLILEHPAEELTDDGGLYFDGQTQWGNRLATWKLDVQNLLIDACKAFVAEYHVDGFRFDHTRSDIMSHDFLRRLATELKAMKPDVLLIAENLPNEADLNLEGWNGFGQWSGLFHDKVKALLRERPFEGQSAGTDNLGDTIYFSRSFAAHTNNVVNYCESHDEDSVAFAMRGLPWLDNPATKDRKGRLGVFATLVALGQPMLYMGQEFNVDRPRNLVTVDWPPRLDESGFFQWCRRLVHLRRRYPGPRLRGFDPAGSGQFEWVLGAWLDDRHGGGHRVVGWRSRPNERPSDALVVLLNFEGYDVPADLELGLPGSWVKLADLERVNDIPPEGTNATSDPATLHSVDGRFTPFTLPSSSGFIYKWEAPLR
jgi:1,4-alpha-glucan branching enzyme